MKNKIAIICTVAIFLLSIIAPVYSLPIRPEEVKDEKQASPGAFIMLVLDETYVVTEEMWSIVQWEDEFGNWTDVDGWQGNFEVGGTKLWWVDYKDFDTGPFRWVVYKSNGGRILTISEDFQLPSYERTTVLVAAP